jgi:arabinose-5-phosphate isomerase
LERGDAIFDLKIRDLMNMKPMYIFEDEMATEALDLMRKKPTNILPVLNRSHKVVGIVHIMDLVSAGI